MALFSYPVCTWLCQYVNMGVRKWLEKSAEKQKYKMRKTANPLSRKAFRAVSFSATKDTSEQSPLCSDVFLCLRQKRRHPPAPLLLLSKPDPLALGSGFVLGADPVAYIPLSVQSPLCAGVFSFRPGAAEPVPPPYVLGPAVDNISRGIFMKEDFS